MTPRNMILIATLLIFAAACVGGSGTDITRGLNQPVTRSGVAPVVVESDWSPGDLPGTEPSRPVDISAILNPVIGGHNVVTAQKGVSALLSTITSGSISTTSPAGGGFSHDYVATDGVVFVEAQDTSIETEYHVSGTVTNVALEDDELSYASIGLVNFQTYDYSLVTAPDAPQSSYMFNQNVYMLIRRDSTDPAGVYRIRLGDYNSKWGSHEALVSIPFDFDLMLEPTNPVVSTPATPPYITHNVGLATMYINGAPIGSSVTYGDNNWGWYRATDWEHFEASTGGTMLMGQVYSSGDTITSTLEFGAQLDSGLPGTNDHPDSWYAKGRGLHRNSKSDLLGPQTPGINWQTAPVGSLRHQSPVVDEAGNIYIANVDAHIHAYDSNGIPLGGNWPVNTLGWRAWGTGTISDDGTIFVCGADLNGSALGAVIALNPDGTVRWTFSEPLPINANQSALLEHNGRIFFGTDNDYIYVLDANTGALINSFFVSAANVEITVPAVSADGSSVYFNTQDPGNSIIATDLNGNVQWTWGVGFLTSAAPISVAPDGNIFNSSSDGNIYSLTPAGTANTQFGGTGVMPGGYYSGIAIDDLGSGSYNLYSLDAGNTLYCYDELGNLQWTRALGGAAVSAFPAIGSDGKIYLGVGSAVHCLNPVNGLDLWTQPVSALVQRCSPAIHNDGSVIIADEEGRVYSIGGGTPAEHEICFGGLVGTQWGIYKMAADGSNVQWVCDSGLNYGTAWSPDGTQIAFSSDENGSHQIYVVNSDGTGKTQLTNYGNRCFGPSWDSSNRILFGGFIDLGGPHHDIYRVNNDGTGFMLLTPWDAMSEHWTSVSPDGTKLVHTRGNTPSAASTRIWISDYPVYGNQYVLIDLGGVATTPDWSPVGDFIAFSSYDGNDFDIWRVNADGTGLLSLTSGGNPESDYHPKFSPDGNQLCFMRQTVPGVYQVFTMNNDGTNETQISSGFSNCYYPDWKPYVAPPTPIEIDCTALSNARFTVRRPDTSVIAGPLTTNSVYDASGDLVTGDQFYVEFQTDPTLSPSDQSVYPARPIAGLVTVNAASLTIDLALQAYFTSTDRTLEMRAGAYSRVTNDLTSLSHALYTMIDSDLTAAIYGPNDTDVSDTETAVLRDGINYRPQFSAESYPTAGSNAAYNGSGESIYPTEWTTGWLHVDGDIPGGGAAAAITELGTVLGDYFTEAGLTATLDSDAFCRFECEPTTLSLDYGFYDTDTASWIVGPPGLDIQAKPWDVQVFARGTRFRVRPTLAPGQSAIVEVTAGQTLDSVNLVAVSTGPGGNANLRVIPDRVWDDPAQPDPDASSTYNGTGWDVDLSFLLQYGTAPYTVEADTDFGAAWDDGTAGRTQTLPNSPYGAYGLYTDTVTVNSGSQPPGSYTFAIRVTDANADQYTFIWPTVVALAVPTGWYNAIPNPDSTDDTGLHTSMKFINGIPSIAYYDFTNGDLKIVHAANSLGTSWNTPITVDATDDVGRFASLEVINGYPAIAYWDGTNGYLMYARAADTAGTDWTGVGSINIIAAQDGFSGGNGVGQHCSLLEVNSRPAISHYNASYGALQYTRAHDASGSDWTGGSEINLLVYNPSGAAGFDTSLAMVNGRPAISYHHRLNGARGNLMFSRASNTNGSAWGGPAVVDTGGASGLVGEYSSLVVVNGNPAISYYWNNSDGDLMYSRSTNANGTAWPAPTTVHNGAGGNLGLWTSMSLINGNPAISYFDATNGDMLYIRSTDTTGGAWGASETVDSAGSVGGYSSLLQVSGQPAMSYYDFTNGDLKYSRYYP